MAESRNKNFISILALLDEPGITAERLRKACKEVLMSRKKIFLDCRHKKSNSECYYRGTLDKGKAPAIRRTHLLNALKISNQQSKSHLRAYHLAFLGQVLDGEILQLRNEASKFEIRHLCGHRNCDNPDHLKLGSVSSNEDDKHYHFILDKVQEPKLVLEMFKQQIVDLDVI